jgi:nicotinamide-nucleotide amidase
MEFESKILSKNISELLYNSEKTLGTAESCTGGRIAEAIISVPGASNYFKGGIVSYTNEVKENILKVSHEVLEEQTAVCEEVAPRSADVHAKPTRALRHHRLCAPPVRL